MPNFSKQEQYPSISLSHSYHEHQFFLYQAFSGDVNNFVSAHKYRVYSPNDELLDLIVNCLVPDNNRFAIGALRLTERRMPLPEKSLPRVISELSTSDLMGTRTAMFGKTRLGKSNIVKLIAQSLIEKVRKYGG